MLMKKRRIIFLFLCIFLINGVYAFCGNNIVDRGEACDGTDLNEMTCSSFAGFKSGTLRCNSDCSGYDVSGCVSGSIINALSCSRDYVQSAIDSAENGDIVLVPAGICNWSNTITIPSNKKITLSGASMNSTIINTANIALTRSGSRLTNFNLNGGYISVDGSIGWRIDHCILNQTGITSRSSVREVHSEGLVDNCIFYNARVVSSGAAAMLYEGPSQHYLWAQPFDLGSGRGVVYLEDNVFTRTGHGNVIDGNYGGRYVFRYNVVNDATTEAHSVQGTNRAHIKWEIYENKINQVSRSMWAPMFQRGGTGVIFNNEITGRWSSGPRIIFDNIRSYAERGEGGFCDGISLWDGNLDETGWPCRDQIGTSNDLWLWTDENPYPRQELKPAYLWNNTHGINPVFVTVHNCPEGAGSCLHIKSNRDYYEDEFNFNGTSGTGFGLFANLPSTCTAGVAYWATDIGKWNYLNLGPDGQLYKCVSDNNWELYYVPYVYPHPLRLQDNGETPPDITPPTDISDIVTIQDMLGAYQQYKRNEVGILYFLDKLRNWIVFW